MDSVKSFQGQADDFNRATCLVILYQLNSCSKGRNKEGWYARSVDSGGKLVLIWTPSPTALPNCSIVALLLKLILSLSLGFEQLEGRNYPYRTKYGIWYLIKVFKQTVFYMVQEFERLQPGGNEETKSQFVSAQVRFTQRKLCSGDLKEISAMKQVKTIKKH